MDITRRQVDHYSLSIKGVDHPRFAGTLVADVTINARSDLTINIDNGEVFNYRWNAMGHPNESFKEFLVKSGGSVDYFMSKVASRSVFDGTATLDMMKRHLLEYRRDDSIDAEPARRVWNILFGDGGIRWVVGTGARSFDEFFRDIEGNLFGDDDQEAMDCLWDHPEQWDCVMHYPHTIEVFFDLMWPELIKHLAEENNA